MKTEAAPGKLRSKKAQVERKVRAREFVFGVQDGLISTVGLISGMAAATRDNAVVAIAGIAAAVTGGLSMATGSYLSSRTEKEIFERELRDQERLASSEPYLAQEALLEALVADGLDKPAAYRTVQMISKREDLLLRTVQEKVLGLGSADISQPVKAATTMFLSFIVGALFPVFPYLIGLQAYPLALSWALSIAALLAVGVARGFLTGRPLIRSGFEFAAIALSAGAAGWVVGNVIERFGPLN